MGKRNGLKNRLWKEKVLSPMTSVVLNGSRFDCSLHEWVLSKGYLQKGKKFNN